MDVNNCDEDPDPLAFLYTAAESLRLFNHGTIAGNLDPGAVYGALGALTVVALRMPQTYEQLAASLRREDTGGRLDADLAGAKHAALAMHEALATAHSNLGELVFAGVPQLPATDPPLWSP
jgi:hypothetical protein